MRDDRWTPCAYCGVLLDRPDDHPMVYKVRRRYVRAGHPHPIREATALKSHEVVNLEPWGRMHTGTCEIWARRNSSYGGAIGPVAEQTTSHDGLPR